MPFHARLDNEGVCIRYDESERPHETNVVIIAPNGTQLFLTSRQAYFLLDMLKTLEAELEADLEQDKPSES